MAIVQYVFSRLVKLIGNLLKGIFYLIHLLFPGLRFEIPAASPPLMSSSRPRSIARIVWQTNYTRRVTLAVYVGYLFNRLMAPTHAFRMLVDGDVEEFVLNNFPAETARLYSKPQIGAAKADLWRLLTLSKSGGVYMDVDASLVWPLELIIGPEDQEIFLNERSGRLTNYFLAACAENSHLKKLIARVEQNISENTLKSVYDITGPTVFNSVLEAEPVRRIGYRTVCIQGTFTNEFFQYMDRPARKWHREEQIVAVVKD